MLLKKYRYAPGQPELGMADLTLALHEEGHHNDRSLHLFWKASASGLWNFEGVFVNGDNLAILRDHELLEQIAELPSDMFPLDCCKLVESWGFVHVRPYEE